jgi:hypothetical protein
MEDTAVIDLSQPQRLNMFQHPWPELSDKVNTAKTLDEACLIFLKMTRRDFEPLIQARINSSGLKGEKLEAYKHKIERDLKEYEEFRALLTSFIKEFRKDRALQYNLDLIKEFREGWKKISGNLDQGWQKLHPDFVLFIFRNPEI